MTQLALLTLFALTVPTVSSVPCKFLQRSFRRDNIPTHPKSLVIPYILFNYYLFIILIIMAHFTISNGIDGITGALKKTTHQGVNHVSVTRRKEHHDPITGEVVGYGPNEMYIKDKRDYNEHPLTPGEKRQRGNWSQACREALVIYRDKSHPRFMELYQRWRAQLSNPDHYKEFLPFIRAVLCHEQ